jgi:peptide deformylase
VRADVDEDGNRLNPDAEMPLVLINPEITWTNDETVLMEEGCLSFPGIYAPIVRPTEAVVRYLDRNGNEQERHARGLLARAIQHEVDHLDGVLIVDRMSRVKKVALSGRLKRLRKETQSQLASVTA